MCKVENGCLKSNNDSFIGCRGIDIFVTLIVFQLNEIVTLTFPHDILAPMLCWLRWLTNTFLTSYDCLEMLTILFWLADLPTVSIVSHNRQG